MLKRIMGIAIAVVMLLSMLSVAGAAGTRNIKEAEDNPFREEIVDLGGRTIKFATGWMDHYDYAEVKEETSVHALKNIQILKDIEEDYNCKIELVSTANQSYWSQDLAEQLALAKSSGDTYADILHWQTNQNPGVVMYRDYLVPFDDVPILKTSLDLESWSSVSKLSQFRNKLYGGNTSSAIGETRTLLLFNKDYAEQYDVGNLFDYVKNDEWTYDKFMEVSEKVYDKSGGAVSSVVTSYGMPSYFLELFMTSNDAVPIDQKDGLLVNNVGTEKSIRGAQFYVDLVNKKLIDLDYIANQDPSPLQYFSSGKSMFFVAQYWEIQFVDQAMEFDFGVLPMPKGPDATDYASFTNMLGMMSIVNTGDAEAIDAAAHVLIALSKRQQDTYLDIETVDENPMTWREWISTLLPDEESIDNVELCAESMVMNYTTMLTSIPGIGDALYNITNLNATPAEALGAIKTAIDAVVEEANK